MIEKYSFGSITIQGRQYRSDLKIINGQVVPDWWRKAGHSVDVDDVTDILDAEPDYLVIGSGDVGLMKPRAGLQKACADRGVEIVIERSGKAVESFNQLYQEGKKVAAGFHLTC